jgi:2-oxoacid:acceptor oxidoreductase gamma subunit (pyruvate/2-ketoisovalerate family)
VEKILREIRFHGRGGQGAVILAQLTARAAFLEGKWPQAMAFFGAERRGAPVEAFSRISDQEILLRSKVYEPDYVVVLDHSLLEVMNVIDGLKERGGLLVNCAEKPKLLEPFTERKNRLYFVDATGIALELSLIVAGQPVVNTAMLGAFAKATGEIKLQSAEQVVRQEWPGEIGELNSKAVRLGYDRLVAG